MKVHLLLHTAGTYGGTERVGFGLAGWLAERGADVSLWAHRGDQVPDGVHLRRYPGLVPRGRPWKLMVTRSLLRRVPDDGVRMALVRAAGADVWRAGGGCHAAWLRASGRTGPLERWETAVDREAARTAGQVVANSALGAHGLASYYGVNAASINVVRNGVDLDRFRPRAPRSPPFPHPWVAFLGGDFARKNLSGALRAMVALPGLGLVVLGGDPRAARWKSEAAALGLADRVLFRGPVVDPEQHLAGARALLLPTRYDASANATLEAMACGVPVVTTARDGASELAPEPWLVVDDPDDHEALAMTVLRILDTPALGPCVRAVAEQWPASRGFAAMEALLVDAHARRGGRP